MTECESVRGNWGEICPDCGRRLPVAKPWDEGRPCSRTSLDRGRGWDGRALPEHTETVKARWSTKAAPAPKPAPGPYQLNPRQAEMLAAVQLHAGNRSAAARDLGVSPPAVDFCMRRLALHGVPVPPPSRIRLRRTA